MSVAREGEPRSEAAGAAGGRARLREIALRAMRRVAGPRRAGARGAFDPLAPPPGPSAGFRGAMAVLAVGGILAAFDAAGRPGPVRTGRVSPLPPPETPRGEALAREVRLLAPALAHLASGDPAARREAAGVVERVARDPSPLRRFALVRALAAVPARTADLPLRLLASDPDAAVRREARRVLLEAAARAGHGRRRE